MSRLLLLMLLAAVVGGLTLPLLQTELPKDDLDYYDEGKELFTCACSLLHNLCSALFGVHFFLLGTFLESFELIFVGTRTT